MSTASWVRLAAPTFDAQDRARIHEVLDSGQLIQGRYVAAFEALVANWLGDGIHVLACSSGTAALHLALLGLQLSPGSGVLVPAFTWPSTAFVIVQAGLVPVFVDIDPATFNIAPTAIPAALEAARARGVAVRAMLPVHLFGVPAEMSALLALAVAWDLRVVEDAACAIGTRCEGGAAGTLGDVGCFSLHPRKTITTGEGGLLTTRDAALAERLGRLRNHGMHRTPDGIVFLDPGLNYRMLELSGALGIGQMSQLDHILAVRRALAARYLQGLADHPHLQLPAGLFDPGHSYQSFTVWLRDAAMRPLVIERLRAHQIETTIGTYCVTDQPVWANNPAVDPAAFPHARAAARSLWTLPLHGAMTPSDVDRVLDVLWDPTLFVPELGGHR